MQKGAWGCEAAEASRDDDDDMFESKGERGVEKGLQSGIRRTLRCGKMLFNYGVFLLYSVIILYWIDSVVIHACVVC